jgi:hypothetical protein
MKTRRTQMHLFAATLPTPAVNADQRNKLLALIEDLLKETAADVATAGTEGSDDEITPDHLARSAYVYVRQGADDHGRIVRYSPACRRYLGRSGATA